jgi:hypothetical protein
LSSAAGVMHGTYVTTLYAVAETEDKRNDSSRPIMADLSQPENVELNYSTAEIDITIQ